MSAYIREFGDRPRRVIDWRIGVMHPWGLCGEPIDELAQVPGTTQDTLPHQRSLMHRTRRQDDLRSLDGLDDRQHPRDMTKGSVESEFAEERTILDGCGRELLAGYQHTDGDGQIE